MGRTYFPSVHILHSAALPSSGIHRPANSSRFGAICSNTCAQSKPAGYHADHMRYQTSPSAPLYKSKELTALRRASLLRSPPAVAWSRHTSLSMKVHMARAQSRSEAIFLICRILSWIRLRQWRTFSVAVHKQQTGSVNRLQTTVCSLQVV